jgi:type I restriction-modification system DNA methylase subunit
MDARTLGRMMARTHRELTDEEIAKIATTYHAWRGDIGQASCLPKMGTINRTLGHHKGCPLHCGYFGILPVGYLGINPRAPIRSHP